MRQSTLNVSLTPQLLDVVREKVNSGQYHSASEVVREALRLMQERDDLRVLREKALARIAEEATEKGVMGIEVDASRRLNEVLELSVFGLDMMQQHLRRSYLEADIEEIEARQERWLRWDDLAGQTSVHVREAPDRMKRLLGE